MRSRIILASAVLVLAAGAVFFGCSKSKNPYSSNPPAGGTTLNLSLPAGGNASFTFNTAGTFPYKCGIHPNIMTGNSVFVDPNSTVSMVTVNVVGPTTPGFNPSMVTVKVGGTVRWVNPPTNGPHSVVNQ